jgi:cysteinyl-tRNA synthetase
MDTHAILQGLHLPTDSYDGSESQTDRAMLELMEAVFAGMDDDFNTAVALGALNELGSYVHKLANQQLPVGDVSPWVLERLKTVFSAMITDIFGLLDDAAAQSGQGAVEGLMQLILDLRRTAREQKDWGASDKIRDTLAEIGITVKDGKDGASWVRG